jgi:hypothetical protein
MSDKAAKHNSCVQDRPDQLELMHGPMDWRKGFGRKGLRRAASQGDVWFPAVAWRKADGTADGVVQRIQARMRIGHEHGHRIAPDLRVAQHQVQRFHGYLLQGLAQQPLCGAVHLTQKLQRQVQPLLCRQAGLRRPGPAPAMALDRRLHSRAGHEADEEPPAGHLGRLHLQHLQ